MHDLAEEFTIDLEIRLEKLGKTQPQGLFRREWYVYDKMIEHMKYLNKEELKHAKRYMNKNYRDYGSENVVDFSFDIDKIPKKRQPVTINKLLKLE
ncbi:hypothetical protein AAEO56_17550 [Flavobacterium sp. DGU11]|uniref:Hydrolases of HD superfamily n=1 Tax=Flavobacterium arundinis TaxID=3139143 RepID=A0ABU9I2B8_9FLAO